MEAPTRNSRKSLIGVVTSRSGDKTIKVTYSYKVPHPLYKKEIRRKTVVHAHDEKNECGLGDKVEIMITDVKSYQFAMYYMLAFNKKENIITYWDEPTITLDYKEHPYHNIIQDNWNKNIIPNMVLVNYF